MKAENISHTETPTTDSTTKMCGGKCGRHFWAWAIVRIVIVVLIIVGAFCLGFKIGSYGGYGKHMRGFDRGGYQMQQGGQFRPDRNGATPGGVSVIEVAPATSASGSTGTGLAATGSTNQ